MYQHSPVIWRSPAWLVIVLATLIALAGSSFSQTLRSIYEIQEVPVGQDSSLFFGDTVLVRGNVTAGAGLFYAGTHITFYMAEPEGGPWNGVLVYNADNSAFATLIGDSVQITAVVGEYNTFSGRVSNMTELVTISEIEILDENRPLPDPIVLTCGVLDSSNFADSLAEQYEGCLVRLENVIVTDNSSPYRQFNVGDATGNCIIRTYSDSLFNYGQPPLGTPFESITGLIYQVYGNYTLMPRTSSDLILATGPPLISGTHHVPLAPTSDDTIAVITSIMDDGGVDQASLFYRLNGGSFHETVLWPIGEITYRGTIPPQPDQTLVEYYIWAMDDEELESTDPANAPSELYSVLVSNSSASTIYDIQYTTNPTGASPYEGTVATVTGVVTADTADFPQASGYRYYIQDTDDPYGTGGAWNGIYVYNSTSDPVTIMATRGDKITVTGTVSEYYGLTELEYISDVVYVSSGNPLPTPVNVTCADVKTGSPDAESFESCLVRLSDITVVNPDLGYGEWSVSDAVSDDTSRVDDDGQYTYVPSAGDHIDYLTGLLKYANNDFKLEPRDNNDIEGAPAVGNDNEIPIPLVWSMSPNYPNPFNPMTVIPFSVPEQANVSIIVYNILGQQVRKLIDATMMPGAHHIIWNGDSDQGVPVSSGIYIVRLNSVNHQLSQKVVLLK
jgi:hypothetical protein